MDAAKEGDRTELFFVGFDNRNEISGTLWALTVISQWTHTHAHGC
jgi:hypothetical protein